MWFLWKKNDLSLNPNLTHIHYSDRLNKKAYYTRNQL